jgi:hypothetical protein
VQEDAKVVAREGCDLSDRRLARPGERVSCRLEASIVICSGSDSERLRVGCAVDSGDPCGIARWLGIQPLAHEPHDVVKGLIAASPSQQCDRARDWTSSPVKGGSEPIVCRNNASRQIVGPQLS